LGVRLSCPICKGFNFIDLIAFRRNSITSSEE
jgi:hypothetical protein